MNPKMPKKVAFTAQPSTSQSYGTSSDRKVQPAAVTFQPEENVSAVGRPWSREMGDRLGWMRGGGRETLGVGVLVIPIQVCCRQRAGERGLESTTPGVFARAMECRYEHANQTSVNSHSPRNARRFDRIRLPSG